ncbi:MAG: D-alanyl-D-alanine carboxypeptidase [Candidatus Delongbacteria bacterium]|nr:D-alanyl-D-alanine carboxypeptidase [Candidatus Delongbacteria bacterium]
MKVRIIILITIIFTSNTLLSKYKNVENIGPDSLRNYIPNNKYTSLLNFKSEFKSRFKDYNNVMLVDLTHQQILYEENGYEMCEIASLTKMMSILLVLEEIKSGKLSYDDTLQASTKASKIGGSQIFLREYERMRVEDLLKAVVIKSANDATFTFAEKIGGEKKVDGFVEMMNMRAKEIGMMNTYFYYPHGLPPTWQERKKEKVRGNRSTCYDLILLAEEMLKYPKLIELSSTWLDYIRDEPGKKKFMLRNTSRLIKDYPYFDGLKTGFYDKAGFNIVATAKKDGVRLVAVVLGTRSMKGRDKFVNKLVTWGFDQVIDEEAEEAAFQEDIKPDH